MGQNQHDCQRCADRIGDYFDGALDAAASHALEQRIAESETCRACFESYEKTRSLCQKTMLAELPDESGDRLMAFLRHHTKADR